MDKDQIYMIIVDKEVFKGFECNTFCTKDLSIVKKCLDQTRDDGTQTDCSSRVWKFPEMVEVLKADIVLTTE